MKLLNKNFFSALLAICLTAACGSNLNGSNFAQAQDGNNISAGGNATPAAGQGTDCGNGNADNGNNATDGNTVLTPVDYKYAFFYRQDWLNPDDLQQTDLYVVITNDPNFCVSGANGHATVTLNSNVPSLSVQHTWTQDSNLGTVVVNPNTYSMGVNLDSHPVETSRYELFDNPNTRICDLYGSGSFNSPTADKFLSSALGNVTINAISATTLDFTLDANMPAYSVPAGRGELPVFSGQTVHYQLQAQYCAFPPTDLTHGAPNAPPAVAVAPCPL